MISLTILYMVCTIRMGIINVGRAHYPIRGVLYALKGLDTVVFPPILNRGIFCDFLIACLDTKPSEKGLRLLKKRFILKGKKLLPRRFYFTFYSSIQKVGNIICLNYLSLMYIISPQLVFNLKQEYRWNRWMLPEHAIVGTGNIILDKERYTVYTHCTSKWSITKPHQRAITLGKIIEPEHAGECRTCSRYLKAAVTLTLSPGHWKLKLLEMLSYSTFLWNYIKIHQ